MKTFGYEHTLLASFWDELTGDSNGYTLMFLIALAAVAVVAIIVAIVLLSLRSKIFFDEGDGKITKVKTARHGAVACIRPEREGYDFVGWFTDREMTRAAEDPVRASARRITLYAKWIKKDAALSEEQPVSDTSAREADTAGGAAEISAASIGETQASAADEAVLKGADGVAREEKADEVSAPAGQADEVSEAAEEAEEGQVASEDTAEGAAAYTSNEPVLAESEDEDEEEDENEAGEGDEIDNALVTLVSGTKVFVQYRRSFRARLIQSDGEMKEYYNQLRNELLSYTGVKERVSWNYDSFNVGRKQFAKVNANRKSLILYLALSPEEVDEKYTFRDVSEKKRYANVPVRYKITGSRSFKYALELLEQTAEKFGADYSKFEEKLVIPYEEREALIRKRLIKVYAKRETGETVSEEELEKYIEEGATVESLSAYTVTDHISVNEAEELISDATAKQLIALADVSGGGRAGKGKRSYINLDTVSANYREGEKVDLDSLKAKGLIDKKAAAYKVLARGSLDKSLTVEANDFSLPAVKMIALTGGKVVKVKKES